MKRILSAKKFTHYGSTNIFIRSFVTENISDSKKNKDGNIEETNQAIVSGVFMTQVYPNMFDEKSVSKSNLHSIESDTNVKSNDFDHYEHIYECDYDFDMDFD